MIRKCLIWYLFWPKSTPKAKISLRIGPPRRRAFLVYLLLACRALEHAGRLSVGHIKRHQNTAKMLQNATFRPNRDQPSSIRLNSPAASAGLHSTNTVGNEEHENPAAAAACWTCILPYQYACNAAGATSDLATQLGPAKMALAAARSFACLADCTDDGARQIPPLDTPAGFGWAEVCG